MHFDHFDIALHEPDPRGEIRQAGMWADTYVEDPLFGVAQRFPGGKPPYESPYVMEWDDERVLTFGINAIGQAADLFTKYERAEIEAIIMFCTNRPPTLLVTLLRQYAARLEYKRYKRMLLAHNAARSESEGRVAEGHEQIARLTEEFQALIHNLYSLAPELGGIEAFVARLEYKEGTEAAIAFLEREVARVEARLARRRMPQEPSVVQEPAPKTKASADLLRSALAKFIAFISRKG